MIYIYKGLIIFRDPAGDGFDVRTRSGQIIETGCATYNDARLVIDDYILYCKECGYDL